MKPREQTRGELIAATIVGALVTLMIFAGAIWAATFTFRATEEEPTIPTPSRTITMQPYSA